jgi:hypothetical protein
MEMVSENLLHIPFVTVLVTYAHLNLTVDFCLSLHNSPELSLAKPTNCCRLTAVESSGAIWQRKFELL